MDRFLLRRSRVFNANAPFRSLTGFHQPYYRSDIFANLGLDAYPWLRLPSDRPEWKRLIVNADL